MLKYKFTIVPLAIRRYAVLLPALAGVIAAFSASDALFSYLARWEVYCLAALMWVACVIQLRCAPQPVPMLVLFDGEQRWQQAATPQALAEAPVRLVSKRSRLTPWGLYVGFDNHQPGQWILKHEIGQADFRRVARAIRAR